MRKRHKIIFLPSKKKKKKRNSKTWQKHKKCLAPIKLTLVVFTET